MARYKHYDYGQMKLLPISFKEQILPGSFEFTLNYLIDHKIDLTNVLRHLEGQPRTAICIRQLVHTLLHADDT